MWARSLGREDAWRKARQPTAALLPGESHGQRSPAGTVHVVTKGETRLSDAHVSFHVRCVRVYSVGECACKMSRGFIWNLTVRSAAFSESARDTKMHSMDRQTWAFHDHPGSQLKVVPMGTKVNEGLWTHL